MADDKSAFDTGLALRRDMFGVAGADKAIEAATDFSRPLQEMVTRHCFGEVWQRPGLDRRTRSMLTLAMLISNGRFTQFAAHVHGAIANGVTELELRELILHSQLYCGIPAAVEATSICEGILRSGDRSTPATTTRPAVP
jgi:4-carboxymuconolactone decarboxylase